MDLLAVELVHFEALDALFCGNDVDADLAEGDFVVGDVDFSFVVEFGFQDLKFVGVVVLEFGLVDGVLFGFGRHFSLEFVLDGGDDLGEPAAVLFAGLFGHHFFFLGFLFFFFSQDLKLVGQFSVFEEKVASSFDFYSEVGDGVEVFDGGFDFFCEV